MSSTHFIVKTAQASMPGSCKYGRYGRVAVLEVPEDLEAFDIPRIDDRLKSVKRIVRLWDRRFWGKTERCAFEIACAEAEALAEKLNEVRGYF